MIRILMPLPCHFKAPAELCATTIVRMYATLAMLESGDIIMLSGDVPFALGGPTLGSLMHDWFIQNGVEAMALCLLRGGVGTFSEARRACQMAPQIGVRKIVLISSDWYLFAGKPIWRRRAKENNLDISYISIPNTGGMCTQLIYWAIGAVVHTGIALGLERPLEQFFTSIQKGRARGFSFKGCA